MMKRVIEPMPFAEAPSASAEAPAWPLAPLLAGARARGVADALEWVGLAAILIDQRGEVLHVNAGAVELMEDGLHREAGRLRADDELADARLRVAVSAALRDGETSDLVVPNLAGQAGLTVRVAPIGSRDEEEAYQLLRVVVVLDPETAPRETRN